MQQVSMKWIKTRIEEPFPVLYGHVGQGSMRLGEARGPFYAAGSEHLTPYDARNLAWKQSSAEALRAEGYTVSVEVIERLTWVASRSRRH